MAKFGTISTFVVDFSGTLKHRNKPLFYFGLGCLGAALLFLSLTQLTDTQVYHVNAWYKPFKFAMSTCLFAWAMAWYCYYLPSFNRTLFGVAVIILLGFEIVYIAIQASKGQLSHYNNSTPFYSVMYSAMGVAATLVTVYTGYVGILFFQHNFPSLPSYYLWAIRLSIFIFVLFSFEGFLMVTRHTHTIGGSDDGTGIPLTNWSTKYGDPRIPHFIGMHALQVLPIVSYYVLKNTKATLIAGALYGALALLTLIQALNGKPFYAF